MTWSDRHAPCRRAVARIDLSARQRVAQLRGLKARSRGRCPRRSGRRSSRRADPRRQSELKRWPQPLRIDAPGPGPEPRFDLGSRNKAVRWGERSSRPKRHDVDVRAPVLTSLVGAQHLIMTLPRPGPPRGSRRAVVETPQAGASSDSSNCSASGPRSRSYNSSALGPSWPSIVRARARIETPSWRASEVRHAI